MACTGVEEKGCAALAAALSAGALPALKLLYVNEELVGSRPQGGGKRVPDRSTPPGAYKLQVVCHEKGIDLSKF